MRVLFDTNVLLDVLASRQPHYAASAAAWTLVETKRVEGFVSAISFNNAFYIVRRGGNRVGALEAVKLIRAVFQTIPVDEAIIDEAIAAGADDFEDGIQVACARSSAMDAVVTRDQDHFPASPIPDLTPDEMLAVVTST